MVVVIFAGQGAEFEGSHGKRDASAIGSPEIFRRYLLRRGFGNALDHWHGYLFSQIVGIL